MKRMHKECLTSWHYPLDSAVVSTSSLSANLITETLYLLNYNNLFSDYLECLLH